MLSNLNLALNGKRRLTFAEQFISIKSEEGGEQNGQKQ